MSCLDYKMSGQQHHKKKSSPSRRKMNSSSKTAKKPSKPRARADPRVRKQGVYSHNAKKCAEITVTRTRCMNDCVNGTMFCHVHQRRPQQHEDDYFDSTFARVYDKVWIGSLDTANDPRVLRAAGIKGIVNISGWEPRKKTREMYRLWKNASGKPSPIRYYTTTTRDRNTGRLRYLGDEPIRDRRSLDDFYNYMDRGVQMIEDCIRKTRGDCLVHCHAGINRSASLVAAWLMAKHGMTFNQARTLLERANRKRDISVLTNSDFVKAMSRYGQRLGRRR